MDILRGSFLVALLGVVLVAQAAVYQYRVTPPRADASPGNAYLWIPPSADQVRGVIVAGKTSIEVAMFKDAQIREVCSQQKLALVLLMPSLDFRDADLKVHPETQMATGGARLQGILDLLAKVSGHAELSVAPLMSVGHSAGGPFAQFVAYWAPQRSFGLLFIKSGGIFPPDYAPDARIYSVPVLTVNGQFDEFGGTMRNAEGLEPWTGGRRTGLVLRGMDERYLNSMMADPGAGHFSWSDRLAAYVAKYIRKAAQARIPQNWPADAKEPIQCKVIDPQSGWLTPPMLNLTGEPAPAAYADYKGDKKQAFWQFDEEMALASVAYMAGQMKKKDQFIKWNDAYNMDAGVRYYFSKVKWVGDGQTFEVHPEFASAYPKGFDVAEGQPVGNCGGTILVMPTDGPIETVGPNRFRMKFDAQTGNRPIFLAYNEGNAEYRHTEVQGMIRNAAALTQGKAQTITFPPIENVTVNSGPVELKATSDSGLPVEYYVAYGPAEITGNRLVLKDLPQGAIYPIEVRVVAYQYGRGLEPLVQTAKQVEQVFSVTEP
ncbi:MAG: hypothetical protein WCJ56_11540 [bacterium]